ncbi:SPARC-related modular calcium-binding protein 1-like isoform X1 [Trachemys scripta elegans]|uniref:SPARC-related modular calcium-binding protein 1-like isoform X1 n=1 Tax=Trachemys scripta elegans TaxID=31138 RepID=UPI0015536D9A|nr:SPARC-related modular calcium-binding protein 1-like isoform X1 [Trachemys scripta elegans]
MSCLRWGLLLLLGGPALAASLRWDRSPFIISESERGPPCPAECPRERHRPVCASDGKLYKSQCVFQRARCQEPLLQALPRFRCGGAHHDPTSLNLTRCQEDRAAALARRQADSIYIPECNEDGSFLQVQCHRQTGYCWCSTTEGKPVSGTSVLNQTPNCTGSYVVRPSWQDPNSSRRVAFELFSSLNAEGGRPRPTPASPPPHKQEEGTSLPFLIPIILPDFKPNRTVKRIQEFPPSCEQERLEALEEIQQRQQEGTFVPECEGDGTYKPVQCHQATGYCWCVQADTGRPVPGTSTRNFPPDCESDAATKSAEMGSLFRDRALPGCPGPKKAEFLSNLMKALTSDMTQSRLMPITHRRLSDRTPGPSLEERAARWHFVRLDKDFSDGLSERELRPLKLYVKQHARPKRCARKFLEYCDLDANRLVSLPELRGCLGLS